MSDNLCYKNTIEDNNVNYDNEVMYKSDNLFNYGLCICFGKTSIM